ncbi:MAG: CinA-like protein [Chloroflexi bacterium]|nr:CinA-like protein [Chloroflexota bacterium]
MRGEIVSVGTEMLLGMIVDTNAQYLTQQLADIGIDVFWISQVGDNLERVVEIINRGRSRSDVVIMTGGLGPTEDDLTRESIGAAIGEELVVDPGLEIWLRDSFARRNRPMPERNLKQATLIPSATSIPNPLGTAPGWWVEHDGTIIAAMPGVPAEMRVMWEHEVRPRLRDVLGLGEAAVEEALGELIHGANPTVATYAKADGVQVRLSAKAVDEATARALLAPVVEQAERALGAWVYGRDEETLAGIAAGLLQELGWALASAEFGTAGALANEITNDDALSTAYRGGFVVAADGGPLGVADGDPSALASAARLRTGAEVGLATAMGTIEGRPSGSIAVDVRGKVQTESSRWNFAIPELRRRVAIEALALLVKALREVH